MQDSITRITVFQQGGSGANKVKGIREFSDESFVVSTYNLEENLPPIIDDPDNYLPSEIEADIVLDYLKHPDLSQDLAALCKRKQIPIVASGKKFDNGWALTPPICCALPRRKSCGSYGAKFGFPEFEITVNQDKVKEVFVLRGAPCGATWKAASRIKGQHLEQALSAIGLETQFYCTANPAGWDPITGKSPLHLAGKVHSTALKLAIRRLAERNKQEK